MRVTTSRSLLLLLAAPIRLLLLLSLSLPASALARHLVPDSRATVLPSVIQGHAVDVTRNGVRMRVEPLEDVQVESWFGLRTADAASPPEPARDAAPDSPALAGAATPAPAAPSPFAVFAVSLENGSGEDLTLLPDMATLKDEVEATFSPLPAEWLDALVRKACAGFPDPEAATSRALRTVISGPLILRPGQRSSRLMFFPAPARSKRLVLTFEHLAVGSKEMQLSFSFAVTGNP